jgi:hypothetical protein
MSFPRPPKNSRFCFICNGDIWNKESCSYGKYSVCDRCAFSFEKWKKTESCFERYIGDLILCQDGGNI